jgi:hypothetical protein
MATQLTYWSVRVLQTLSKFGAWHVGYSILWWPGGARRCRYSTNHPKDPRIASILGQGVHWVWHHEPSRASALRDSHEKACQQPKCKGARQY